MTSTTTLAQDTTNLRRGTYKGLGQPQSFYYWGTEKAADEQLGTLVTSVTVEGTQVKLEGDFEVRTLDVRTRFWISDVPADADAEPPAGDTAKPVVTVVAKRPSRNAKLHPCLCGACNRQVKGLYAQGHDARHASLVATAIINLLASDPDASSNDLMLSLPTEALRAKAANIVAKRIAK